MLSLVWRLIRLRKALPALTLGSYRPLDVRNDSVLAYLREHDDGNVLVALNFGAENLEFSLETAGDKLLLCSTRPDRSGGRADPRSLKIGPHEGVILSLG